MESRMMFIHALSPVHVGTGQSVDVIDLPIAREKTTNWPCIPGSSLKGVLRDICSTSGDNEKLKKAFGPDTGDASESAGQVLFCDAKILCLPVRSFKGTFAWVTCPSVLRRVARDCKAAELGDFPTLSNAIQESNGLVCASSLLPQGDKIYLEDLDINVTEDNNATNVARKIAKMVFDENWKEEFVSRFAIISDDMFSFLCDNATEIVARIKIQDDTKTVQTGGLWYEESVPSESIFWCPLLCEPLNGNSAVELFDFVSGEIKKNPVIQLGGSASVGRGLVRIVIREGV